MSIRVSNPRHSLVAHILHSAVEESWLAIDGSHVAGLRRDEGGLGGGSITRREAMTTVNFSFELCLGAFGYKSEELVNLCFDLVSI